MAKTNWQDPKSGEIISPHISGLQEAIGKLEESLGISSTAETDIALSEVYISDSDRYRIYQAPEGKRNWLSSPAPIIKKNGVEITTGFIIEYGGGAVVFTPPLLSTDVVTADATYTVKETTDIKTQINTLDALVGLGGVVGSGNNANGEYIRFEDGTQICWHKANLGSRIAAGTGTLTDPYRTSTYSWVYPVSFTTLSGKPFGIVSKPPDVNVRLQILVVLTEYTASCSVQSLSVSSVNTDAEISVNLFAIGRWK